MRILIVVECKHLCSLFVLVVLAVLVFQDNADVYELQCLQHFRRALLLRGKSSSLVFDRLFEKVLKTSLKWGNEDNMMYVVGATKAEMLADIRKIIPNHFLLVPGIGAQGGSLADVVKHGMNKQCGLLVNSSRAILYASNGEDYAQAAAAEAKKVQQQMSEFLKSLE